MSRKLEKVIENYVCGIASKYGIPHVKLNVMSQTGWPDRMFLIPGGKPLFIEFKRPGAVAYPRQLHIHKLLRHFGYEVQVHDDSVSAVKAIVSALEAARIHENGNQVPAESRSGGAVPGPGPGEDQHRDGGTEAPV